MCRCVCERRSLRHRLRAFIYCHRERLSVSRHYRMTHCTHSVERMTRLCSTVTSPASSLISRGSTALCVLLYCMCVCSRTPSPHHHNIYIYACTYIGVQHLHLHTYILICEYVLSIPAQTTFGLFFCDPRISNIPFRKPGRKYKCIYMYLTMYIDRAYLNSTCPNN